jgi:hypothetical protein
MRFSVCWFGLGYELDLRREVLRVGEVQLSCSVKIRHRR